MVLTGLESDAGYVFQVICTDPAQNQVTSREYTIETDPNSRWHPNWKGDWDDFGERFRGRDRDDDDD
jgi:hypothetical protein